MHSIWFSRFGVEDKAGFVSTVGEDLEPLVEGGHLWLEEDVPLFEEAEAALLAGGVVAVPPCLDGPGDGVGDARPLQRTHMLAQGGAFRALHVLVLHVVCVAPKSLLEGNIAHINFLHCDISHTSVTNNWDQGVRHQRSLFANPPKDILHSKINSRHQVNYQSMREQFYKVHLLQNYSLERYACTAVKH